MDQNIIILVLILIAILVSFYSTYLSMDNSRKIRQLQNDIRDTLGNINTTLNMEKQHNPSPPIHKTESRTNLQDLDQFPSLEEIENYDAQQMMGPIDPELKQELDNILEDDSVKNDETNERERETVEQVARETVAGAGETVAGEEVRAGETVEEVSANTNTEGESVVVVDANVNESEDSNSQEPLKLDTETTEINLEDVMNNNSVNLDANEDLEALNSLDNSVLNNSNEPDVNMMNVEAPDVAHPDENLLQEIDALFPENVMEKKAQEDAESVLGEADKKHSIENFPPLEELNEDILQKMHDKNVKLICKRESLKVRGTKVERIKRILEAVEYKINLN